MKSIICKQFLLAISVALAASSAVADPGSGAGASGNDQVICDDARCDEAALIAALGDMVSTTTRLRFEGSVAEVKLADVDGILEGGSATEVLLVSQLVATSFLNVVHLHSVLGDVVLDDGGGGLTTVLDFLSAHAVDPLEVVAVDLDGETLIVFHQEQDVDLGHGAVSTLAAR